MVERAFAGLNPMGPEYRKLSRYFRRSFVIKLDAAGRVTLPRPAARARDDREGGGGRGRRGQPSGTWSRAAWEREQQELDAGIEEVTARLGNPS